MANITGANAFVNLTLPEERDMINEGFEANGKGIQIAGFLSYVLNQSSGIQWSGGLNVVGGDFKGFQLVGIGNSAGGSVVGVQLAGFYNLTNESTGGFQISSLFNYTNAQLSGIQIALINKAQIIKGKKTSPPTKSRGLQIGLSNFSREMDGLQVALINFAGAMRGKQIGLINFFNKNGTKEHVRNGTPIGLLNFGSSGTYFRLYYNEILPTNFEISSGNCLNCSYVFWIKHAL